MALTPSRRSRIRLLEGEAGVVPIPALSQEWGANRTRRPLSDHDMHQIHLRLGGTQCRYIVVKCETHGKAQCKEADCKPPKIAWSVYRRVEENNDGSSSSSIFRWHCGLIDNATNLAPISTGPNGDSVLLECMLDRLTNPHYGRHELNLTDVQARVDRMWRHCIQSKVWVSHERLQLLVPTAYDRAARFFQTKKDNMRLDKVERTSQAALSLGQDAVNLGRSAVQLGQNAIELGQSNQAQIAGLWELVSPNKKHKAEADVARRTIVEAVLTDMVNTVVDRVVKPPPLPPLPWPVTSIDSTTIIAMLDGKGGEGLPTPPQGPGKKPIHPFRKAIKDYGQGSNNWNPGLRGTDGKQLTQGQIQEVEQLQLALKHAPSVNDGTVVYRGSQHSLEAIEQMATTRTFSDPAFLSTSYGGIDLKFWETNCHFIIQSKNGKFVRDFVRPNYKAENEVLHTTGTVFTVLDIKTPAKPWLFDQPCFLIWLEEV